MDTVEYITTISKSNVKASGQRIKEIIGSFTFNSYCCCLRIRPRNVIWQVSFVIFMFQSKHSTSQWNGRRISCCGRRQKHRIKIPISNQFSIHQFHTMNRNYLSSKIVLNNSNWCKTIDLIVNQWFFLAKMNTHPLSLCENKRIANDLWNLSFNPMFSRPS